MKIEIIKAARVWDAVEGWRLSRDVDADYKATDVIAVDAPVSEFPSALLNFTEFTIIEREIFCSLRSHCVWARTSRVDDATLFTVPPELADPVHEDYRAEMILLKNHKRAQDQWRLLLPIVSHTAWTQRIHVRDLAKLILYFKYLSQECFINLELSGRFNAVSLCLTDTLQAMLEADCTKALLSSVKLAKYLNEKPIEHTEPRIWHDEFFQTVHVTVPIALRAQIVRHRELQFVDNFLQTLMRPDVNQLRIGHSMAMVICARRDIWQAVMGKRTCWLAQTDLWAPLTVLFGTGALPCADGNCPYKVDVQARLENKDPGIPCPRYCNLYELDKTPFLSKMKDAARHRGGDWKKELT